MKDYLVVRNFLSKDELPRMKAAMDQYPKSEKEPANICGGNTYGMYGLHYEELENLTDKMSKIVGKDLEPSYTYCRIYHKGSTLPPHRDRPACEYSVTINISGGQDWPIYMDGNPVTLEEGDGVIYKGCDVPHWRHECPSDEVHQVFLHYVDANGEYADESYEYLRRFRRQKYLEERS